MIARRYEQQRRAAGRAAGTATVEILTSASGNGTRTVFSRPRRRTESSSNQGNPPPPFPFENLAGSYTGGVDWNWAGGAPEVMKCLCRNFCKKQK